MSKRLRNFIYRSCVTALVLGLVMAVYEEIGPKVAGDNYTLILWVIRSLSAAVVAFIGWRLYVGIRDGHLLFDDPND